MLDKGTGSYLFNSVLSDLDGPDWACFYAKERFRLAGNWLFQGLEGWLRWRCCYPTVVAPLRTLRAV